MKKNNEMLNKLKKIQLLFNEIYDLVSEFPNDYNDVIFDFHNDNFSLQHCTRWGLTATDEIIADFDSIVKKVQENH